MIRKHDEQPLYLELARAPHRAQPNGPQYIFTGTSGDDRFVGSETDDRFYMGQGGDDHVDGGLGDDNFHYDATFGIGDRVIGGEGDDALLTSDPFALTLTDELMTGVEIFTVELPAGAAKRITIAPTLTNETGSFVIAAYGDSAFDFTVSAAGSALDIGFLPGADAARFLGGDGDDYVRYTPGVDVVFDGAAGRNGVAFHLIQDAGVTVDLTLTTTQRIGDGAIRLANVDDIIGTRNDDVIRGTDGDNWIDSRGGNDVLQGFGGDDLIMPGASSYPYYARVYVDAGSGFDVVGFIGGPYSGVSVNLNNRGYQDVGVGVFRLLGVEGVSGTDYYDVVAGGEQKNTLYGGGGGDVLNGQGGADILFGDSSLVSVGPYGYPGVPVVVASLDASDDVLKGGNGNDILYGEGEKDLLVGGLGADRLYGGEDADTFVYTAITESRGRGVDTIGDFYGVLDRIDVSAIDSDTAASGDQSFHLGATAGRTGDITFAFDAATNVTSVLFYVDGDARPDMLIKLTGDIALDASCFYL